MHLTLNAIMFTVTGAETYPKNIRITGIF